MVNYILFLLVILGANIMQGITGFAGTILAMSPSLLLVGYPIAKPVLNVLALISGFYVFVGNVKNVNWKELWKIVAWMAAGIGGGIFIQGLFAEQQQALQKLLGVFVVFLAAQGLYKIFRPKPDGEPETPKPPSKATVLFLPAAGIVHGIFVSGGPLLVSYLTKKNLDKVTFRATISTVWVFLNSIVLIDDIRTGLWNPSLLKVQLISIPFLLAGMFIGSKLYARMSQQLFMKITYVLLLISGISLLVK
ncbi:MAG: sulfite exporter TauE/SafE family protein [Oscillibacter sp.]|nr:sulfite exporter TauE/SafE family protein [Oscillibacter sp.]MCI9481193.1 sulfite exporter TauE/SafE family protein [Oscillibacter sp.]